MIFSLDISKGHVHIHNKKQPFISFSSANITNDRCYNFQSEIALMNFTMCLLDKLPKVIEKKKKNIDL